MAEKPMNSPDTRAPAGKASRAVEGGVSMALGAAAATLLTEYTPMSGEAAAAAIVVGAAAIAGAGAVFASFVTFLRDQGYVK